jgi:hypothetical protein
LSRSTFVPGRWRWDSQRAPGGLEELVFHTDDLETLAQLGDEQVFGLGRVRRDLAGQI